MDGGFPAHDQIDAVADRTRVIAPVPKPKSPRKDKPSGQASGAANEGGDAPEAGDAASPAPAVDPHQRKPGDSAAVGEWRERMGTDGAKALYKERAAVAECVNAQARMQYGLTQLRVRGLAKVRCVALWVALAHNLRLLVRRAGRLAATAVAA